MYVVNTFRTSKGPPKFCIDLEADWLLILDEVGGKSPGISFNENEVDGIDLNSNGLDYCVPKEEEFCGF